MMPLEKRMLLSAPVMIAKPEAQFGVIGDGGAIFLGGVVFYDNHNADPILQGTLTPDDDGIPNVEVDLGRNIINNVLQIQQNVVTAGDGTYGFSNLAPGNYYLQFIVPPGYTISPLGINRNTILNSIANPQNGMSAAIAVAYDPTSPNWAHENCGMFNTTDKPPFIGGMLFNDANADGLFDNGEMGIGGATVVLEDGAGNVVAVTTTSTATGMVGLYSFPNTTAMPPVIGPTAGASPGNPYVVHFVLPAGFGFYSAKEVNNSPTQYSWVNPNTGNTDTINVLVDTAQTDVNCGVYALSMQIVGPTNATTVMFDPNEGIPRPHSGFAIAYFSVSIIPPVNDSGVTVPYQTQDISAVGGYDYVSQSGNIFFPAGVTLEQIQIQIIGDLNIENDVSFRVIIHPPPQYTNNTTTATCIILNTNFPDATVTGSSVTRSATQTENLPFTVSLNLPAPFPVIVPYLTSDYSAVSGTDYTATTGDVTFTAGQTSKTVDVPVLPGTSPQSNKQFYLVLDDAEATTVTTPLAKALGTIVSNAGPQLSIADNDITESLLGTTNLPLTITLAPALPSAVTVDYATADGTAIAGVDYGATSGSITFAIGQTSAVINVPVYRVFTSAQDKTFTMTISDPGGTATVVTPTATATIHDIATVALPFDQKTSLKYTDYLLDPVTVSLSGPGQGTLVFLGTTSSDTNAFEIILNGSTSASILTVKTKPSAQTSFMNLLVTGSLSQMVARTSNVLGQISVSGSLNKLMLNYLQASSVTIGAGVGSLTMNVTQGVLNTDITSAIPIASLTAAAFTASDGVTHNITAPSVGTIRIKGDLLGALVQTASVAMLNITGSISGSSILATDKIGPVIAGGIAGSTIFAGILSTVTTLPNTAADFTNQSASITSVRTKTFSDSLIAAWKIGAVTLGTITTTNGGTPFGIAGDQITSVRSTVPVIHLININSTSTPFAKDDFTVQPV